MNGPQPLGGKQNPYPKMIEQVSVPVLMFNVWESPVVQGSPATNWFLIEIQMPRFG